MAKFSTILKRTAKAYAKEADYRRMNTNVEKSDNVTFSDFTWLVNPNRGTGKRILGIVLNLFLFAFPLINIYFLYRYWNMFFLEVKKNSLKDVKHEVRTKHDRRYKSGYRIEGSRYVTKYKHDKSNPYSPLTEKEIKFNRNWGIALGIISVACLFILPSFWVGLVLGAIISYPMSISKNKKSPANSNYEILNFDIDEVLLQSIEVNKGFDESGEVKFIDYQAKLPNPELRVLDTIEIRIFSEKKELNPDIQTHITLFCKSIRPTISDYKEVVNSIANFCGVNDDFWGDTDKYRVETGVWRGRTFFLDEDDMVSIEMNEEHPIEVSIMSFNKML